MARGSWFHSSLERVMRQNRRNVLKLGVSGAVAGWTGGFAGFARAQAAITARIGHLEAPTQPRHKGLEKVAALVKERTKGAVEIQLFPSSQLGNARQIFFFNDTATTE